MAGLPMTVRELIEELQRQPNLDAPVRACGHIDRNDAIFENVRAVIFQGSHVEIALGYGERPKQRMNW